MNKLINNHITDPLLVRGNGKFGEIGKNIYLSYVKKPLVVGNTTRIDYRLDGIDYDILDPVLCLIKCSHNHVAGVKHDKCFDKYCAKNSGHIPSRLATIEWCRKNAEETPIINHYSHVLRSQVLDAAEVLRAVCCSDSEKSGGEKNHRKLLRGCKISRLDNEYRFNIDGIFDSIAALKALDHPEEHAGLDVETVRYHIFEGLKGCLGEIIKINGFGPECQQALYRLAGKKNIMTYCDENPVIDLSHVFMHGLKNAINYVEE